MNRFLKAVKKALEFTPIWKVVFDEFSLPSNVSNEKRRRIYIALTVVIVLVQLYFGEK